MWDLAILVVGLAGLWAGSELALAGATRLVERLGISQGVVGLTLLAVGTDLPELLVAVSGGFHQLRGIEASGVIVGNAVGSAITQTGLVLGVAGMLAFLPVARRMVRHDGLVLCLAVALLAVLASDGTLGRLDAAVMLVVYLIYAGALIEGERSRRRARRAPPIGRAGARSVLQVGAGLLLLVVAASLVVDHAVALAARWHVTQALVGVLVVGAGTSLPELVLSVRAALRGQAELSVGNVVGSNIFDLLVPAGVSGLLHPVSVGRGTLVLDLPAVAVLTGVVLYFFSRRGGLRRPEARTLLTLFGVYAALRLAFALVPGAGPGS